MMRVKYRYRRVLGWRVVSGGKKEKMLVTVVSKWPEE